MWEGEGGRVREGILSRRKRGAQSPETFPLPSCQHTGRKDDLCVVRRVLRHSLIRDADCIRTEGLIDGEIVTKNALIKPLPQVVAYEYHVLFEFRSLTVYT